MRLIRVQLISTKSMRWFPAGNGFSHAQPAEQPARGALDFALERREANSKIQRTIKLIGCPHLQPISSVAA